MDILKELAFAVLPSVIAALITYYLNERKKSSKNKEKQAKHNFLKFCYYLNRNNRKFMIIFFYLAMCSFLYVIATRFLMCTVFKISPLVFGSLIVLEFFYMLFLIIGDLFKDEA